MGGTFSQGFPTERLEKEYTTIKNKEMEEQIEIKVRMPLVQEAKGKMTQVPFQCMTFCSHCFCRGGGGGNLLLR